MVANVMVTRSISLHCLCHCRPMTIRCFCALVWLAQMVDVTQQMGWWGGEKMARRLGLGTWGFTCLWRTLPTHALFPIFSRPKLSSQCSSNYPHDPRITIPISWFMNTMPKMPKSVPVSWWGLVSPDFPLLHPLCLINGQFAGQGHLHSPDQGIVQERAVVISAHLFICKTLRTFGHQLQPCRPYWPVHPWVILEVEIWAQKVGPQVLSLRARLNLCCYPWPT